MKNRIIIAAAVLAVGIVGLVFVVANQKAPAPVTTQAPLMEDKEKMEAVTATPSASASPSAMVEGMQSSESATTGVKEFTVEGSSFKFAPSTITVSKGDIVKITFNNTAGIHDFVIDELGVKTPVLQSGKQAVVEFTADKAGQFEYYCSVGNHRAMGMKGMLIVK